MTRTADASLPIAFALLAAVTAVVVTLPVRFGASALLAGPEVVELQDAPVLLAGWLVP